MKVGLKVIWWGLVLALVVVYFGAVITFRQDVGWGMLAVIVICVFIGVLITMPLSEAISGKLMDKVFGVKKGKVPKDYSKARGFLAEERFQEAMAEFRKALEEEPENVSLRLEIAEIYARDLRDYRRAIEEYEAALPTETGGSERASILNRIADMYENLGDDEMAVRALARVGEGMPGTKFAERAGERIAGIRGKERSGSGGIKGGA